MTPSICLPRYGYGYEEISTKFCRVYTSEAIFAVRYQGNLKSMSGCGVQEGCCTAVFMVTTRVIVLKRPPSQN